MIHIGAIRKIFRGWRILICAWVDDNSPLKSQFFMLFRSDNGKEYIKIGKSEGARVACGGERMTEGGYEMVNHPICRGTRLGKVLCVVWPR